MEEKNLEYIELDILAEKLLSINSPGVLSFSERKHQTKKEVEKHLEKYGYNDFTDGILKLIHESKETTGGFMFLSDKIINFINEY